MTLPLIEKYRAKNLNDIKGQDNVISDVRSFLMNFPKKKALVLTGPVGTGKTSIALALAADNDLELFELNASDLRNKSSLEEVLKPSIEQQSLFKKGKLILMDEADGITGSDRGGVVELIRLIDSTKFPIIITANDIWNKKFSGLRRKCKIVTLKELSNDVVVDIINDVLKKEEKTLGSDVINLIVKKARGDIRAVLNDLQSVFSIGEKALDKMELSEREKQDNIFNALKVVFQSPTDDETIRIYDNAHMQLDEVLLWIEENIPLEYRGQALAKAYDALSKADVFKGRIYRQQYWRFLVYQNFFLSAGISTATKIKYNKFIAYKRPSRILKIWLSNQRNAKKKAILIKYAKLCHMSKKKAAKESFLLPLILSEIDEKTVSQLDLDEKDLDYLADKEAAIVISSGLNKFRV